MWKRSFEDTFHVCAWYPENILWKISFGRHVEYIFMISQTYSQKDIFWETCWIYLHDIKNISSRRYISKIYLMYIIVIYSRDMTCFEQDPDIKRYPKYISCLLGRVFRAKWLDLDTDFWKFQRLGLDSDSISLRVDLICDSTIVTWTQHCLPPT